MLPEEIKIRVSLVIILTIEAFEIIRAWFTLLDFQSERIRLTITFVALPKVSVVFGFVWTITFDAF